MLQIQAGDVGIIVLEPENLRRLQTGNPIRVPLEKFQNIRVLALDYTTDAEWLAEQLAANPDPLKVTDLITESAKRPEPPLRKSHPPLVYSGKKGQA